MRPFVALVVVLTHACGGSAAPPPQPVPIEHRPAAPATAPDPLAAAVATLPLSIISIEPRPIAWLRTSGTAADPVFRGECWGPLVDRVQGYYQVERATPRPDALLALEVIHGELTAADVAACLVADPQRERARDPRVVIARDAGFFPEVYATV